jgi:hypothetical protein
MLKKLGLIIFCVLLALPVAIAQTANMEINVVGYGKTGQEVYISFRNTGDVQFTDVNISVDGKIYKTVQGVSPPGSNFVDWLFLREGDHLIEARTPEGAYDSLRVTVIRQEGPTPGQNSEVTEQPFQLSALSIGFIMLTIVIVSLVVVWTLIRKSK